MIIIKLVNELGLHRWKEISAHLENRTPRQCRERWTHYLSPDVATSPWTAEDDRILEEKYREFGGKWTKIKEFLPNKTAINIKNRYSLLKRKKMKRNSQQKASIKPVQLPIFNINELLNTPQSINYPLYLK